MKTKLLLACFCLGSMLLHAQVIVNVQVPGAGMIPKEALWNLTLVNNGEDFLSATIRMSVVDVQSGQTVLSANTGSVLLRKGVKLLNAQAVQPVSYNYGAGDLSKGFLPLGLYNACYQVYRSDLKGEALIGEECVKFSVDPLSPPLLNAPSDRSELQTPYPQFVWMPPAPVNMFSSLMYDLLVVEVLPGQTASEAIQYNAPIYSKANILNTSEPYPPSFLKLDTAKTYAWQVIAKNNTSFAAKTEIWTFKIKGTEVSQFNDDNEGYITLNNELTGIYNVKHRKLQIKYFSYSKDYTARIAFTDEKDKAVLKAERVIKPGENFLDFSLPSRFVAKKLYKITIKDNDNKTYLLRFIIQ